MAGHMVVLALLLLAGHAVAEDDSQQRVFNPMFNPVKVHGGVNENGPSCHTIFSCECGPYFDWQTVGLIYSFVKSGQPGAVTRLLSCTDDQLRKYRGFDLAPTHIVPHKSRHPTSGDWYPPYNKPYAVWHWLTFAKPQEDIIIMLDADMVLRKPLLPQDIGVHKGHAVAALYGYMIGADNELKDVYVRKPQQKYLKRVGHPAIMHREDLTRMAPMWFNITEGVREDHARWGLLGDAYNSGWISEMYGYVFGSAIAEIDHTINETFMLYAGYAPRPEQQPSVLHYGLLVHVDGCPKEYGYDKHWWPNQDFTACPGKYFPVPPRIQDCVNEHDPNKLKAHEKSIECVDYLNEALMWSHRKRCGPPGSKLPGADQLTTPAAKYPMKENLGNERAGRAPEGRMKSAALRGQQAAQSNRYEDFRKRAVSRMATRPVNQIVTPLERLRAGANSNGGGGGAVGHYGGVLGGGSMVVPAATPGAVTSAGEEDGAGEGGGGGAAGLEGAAASHLELGKEDADSLDLDLDGPVSMSRMRGRAALMLAWGAFVGVFLLLVRSARRKGSPALQLAGEQARTRKGN